MVTGGTKGLGLAIAEVLLREGYCVTLTYGSDAAGAAACAAALGETYGSERVATLRCHLGKPQERAALVAHLKARGQLHALIFNAGTTLRKGFTEFTDEEWHEVMDVNLNASVFLLRDLYEEIADDSRIVLVGSLMGVQPHAMSLAYGVSKAAVHALAQNLVKCFADKRTTVNAIAPGFIETDWQREKPQAVRDNICRKVAAHRFAQPEEIASVVELILKNSYLNGSVLEVSGGYAYE